KIFVIELADDGHASKVTTFAEGLDIPVGIYPITDGSRVIAYDINNTCLHTDTDGDGKADKREVLYSGWGYQRDTHGMSSNYRRGFDGWLYGCHGFNNISDVKGHDGQVMHLRSGNTYRMRLDGSHVEPFTIGRINRDKLEYHGSSPRAIEQPDFLSTDDPWFRPVNTVLGPDGALYVADFYNRIIAHYEIKLDDPRRDYERGRIWRITYNGAKPAKLDLSTADAKELIEQLDNPNLTIRMLASNELSDRLGK